MRKFPSQNAAATAGLLAAPLVPTIAPAFYAGSTSADGLSIFYATVLLYVFSLILGGLLGLLAEQHTLGVRQEFSKHCLLAR